MGRTKRDEGSEHDHVLVGHRLLDAGGEATSSGSAGSPGAGWPRVNTDSTVCADSDHTMTSCPSFREEPREQAPHRAPEHARAGGLPPNRLCCDYLYRPEIRS